MMTINKNAKYLMFFDLDGTLLFDGTIDNAVKKALNAAKNAGHRIILNTGRSRAFLPEAALGIDWDGLICGTSYTEYRGKVIMNDCVPSEFLLIAAEYCDENRLPVRFEGVRQVLTMIDGDPFKNITGDYRKVLPFTDDISKVTVCCPINDGAAEYFARYFDLVRLPTYTELLQKGKTKASGMKLIAEIEGVSRGQIVAFGDSLNDRGMLEYAGISVVMKNAPAELDLLADIRTSEDITGVSEIMNRYFI